MPPTLQELAERAKNRSEREARLAEMRERGKAEGFSDRFIDECDASMRSAFAMGDMLDSLFGGKR